MDTIENNIKLKLKLKRWTRWRMWTRGLATRRTRLLFMKERVGFISSNWRTKKARRTSLRTCTKRMCRLPDINLFYAWWRRWSNCCGIPGRCWLVTASLHTPDDCPSACCRAAFGWLTVLLDAPQTSTLSPAYSSANNASTSILLLRMYSLGAARRMNRAS